MLRSYIYPLAVAPVALIVSALPLPGQSREQVRHPWLEIGIAPATVLSVPAGDLTSVRGGAPCSDAYEPGSNVNLSFLLWGAWVFPAAPDESPFFRALRLSAGFDDISTGWEGSAPGLGAFDNVSGRYTTVQTEQRLDFALKYLRASLEAELGLAADLRMRIGPSISVPLSGSSRERETIVSPENATFLDRTQERSIAAGTGDVDDLGTRVGLATGIAYRLPLGRHLFFEPQIAVDYGLTKIQPEWSTLLVRGGIDIGYVFFDEAPPAPVAVVEEPAPVVREEPRRPAFTATVAVDVSAAHLPIEFRRQIVARYVPVLPVLFFEQGSSEIPRRYHLQGAGAAFSESSVAAGAIDAHRDVLSVIGSRLRTSPRASVTVTGTTSSDEGNRRELAEARAERVAAELSRTWGIDRRRISVRGSLDPTVPSNSEYPEGREENRRVEFEFSDPKLYEPIHLRVVEPITEPRTIDFVTDVSTAGRIDRWDLTLGSPAGPLDHIDGAGAPPDSVSWELTSEDREHVLSAGSVSYRLSIYDSLGRYVSSASRALPVRVDTTITVTSSASRPANSAEFLLVTFEYDRAQLTRRGMEEMKEILARIGPGSSVSVVGYTDALGDAAHNRTLAAERARRVASLLPAGTRVEVRGASPEEAPYGSDSPEGRFLSRTVRVTVSRPEEN